MTTLAQFAPRFLSGYAEANRQKRSGIAAKRSIIDIHLVPHLGWKRLDEIDSEDVQQIESRLKVHGHLRGARVGCRDDDGKPLTQKVVQGLVHWAARRAGLTDSGVHLLRHSFCSHLAMRGASAKAIPELTGHRDLTTTQM